MLLAFFLFFVCVFQGREDQAEETLLQLIRDPYNLGDASWTPESAAETAEWRRLEVRFHWVFFFFFFVGVLLHFSSLCFCFLFFCARLLRFFFNRGDA